MTTANDIDVAVQIKQDEQITKKLMETGYLVIQYWCEHPNIFGAMPA